MTYLTRAGILRISLRNGMEWKGMECNGTNRIKPLATCVYMCVHCTRTFVAVRTVQIHMRTSVARTIIMQTHLQSMKHLNTCAALVLRLSLFVFV